MMTGNRYIGTGVIWTHDMKGFYINLFTYTLDMSFGRPMNRDSSSFELSLTKLWKKPLPINPSIQWDRTSS